MELNMGAANSRFKQKKGFKTKSITEAEIVWAPKQILTSSIICGYVSDFD